MVLDTLYLRNGVLIVVQLGQTTSPITIPDGWLPLTEQTEIKEVHRYELTLSKQVQLSMMDRMYDMADGVDDLPRIAEETLRWELESRGLWVDTIYSRAYWDENRESMFLDLTASVTYFGVMTYEEVLSSLQGDTNIRCNSYTKTHY